MLGMTCSEHDGLTWMHKQQWKADANLEHSMEFWWDENGNIQLAGFALCVKAAVLADATNSGHGPVPLET
jgi:hypothetical protein